MAFIVRDVRLFTGGADLTSRTNKIDITAEVDEKDVTSFASAGWKEVIGGLASTAVEAEGYWDAGDSSTVDSSSWTGLGGVGAWTICPDTTTVSSPVWLVNALRGTYTLGGGVGDVAPWTASASSTWPLVRGRIAHPPGTARTSTGAGTGIELAAVTQGQQLYASLHVLSIAGTGTPSITVTIESDADNSFATPISRIIFNTATTRGGQILRTPAPITDTWYRAKWTITGTSPSFLFVVALGIQ